MKLPKWMDSYKFAINGLLIAIKEQRNLRIHFILTLVVLSVSYLCKVSTTEWTVLLLCIGWVVSLELINTAIEQLVDMISPEWKTQAGNIKDIAAAAVFFSSCITALVGTIIFISHVL